MPKFPKSLNMPEPLRDPRIGTQRTVLLFVDFADNSASHNVADYDALLFSENTNSMKDYYHEVSYNQFTVEGDLWGWYRAPELYSYYTAGGHGVRGTTYPRNAQGLVEDVVALADPDVDFSLYDADGNDTLDGLFVVHAGPGAEETGDPDDIWSHKWSLSDPSQGCPGAYLTDDGVYVDVYSTEPEEFQDGSLVTIGVFCHEFCHVLGAPDLYNTSTGNAVVGRFGLMDAGSWNGSPAGSSPAHMSPLFKYFFGWIEPTPVEREGTVDTTAEFPSVERDPVVYRILPNPGACDWNWSGGAQGEYFLIENRQQTGFDQPLPGSGLLIWHIDESQVNNNDQYERLAAIMQADGESSTETPGEATDLWSSSAEGFCNSSTPSSSLWDGTPTGASVKNISLSSPLMTADLSVGLLLLGRIYSYPNPFEKRRPEDKVTISYVPTDEERARGITPHFEVTIYNLAGEEIRVLDGSGEVNAPWRQAFWDGKNDGGEEVASGLYFYIIETTEERNKGKLTFIH